MPAIVLILLLSLLPLGASAQVYKCKGKSGETAYSEYPCDAAAQPMKLREERAANQATAPLPAAGETAATTADNGTATAPANPEIDRTAERECIASATVSIYGPSNDRVATYQQQMGMLDEQRAKAPDLQREQELQARMTRLRQAISNEHVHAHELANQARKRCIEQFRTTP